MAYDIGMVRHALLSTSRFRQERVSLLGKLFTAFSLLLAMGWIAGCRSEHTLIGPEQQSPPAAFAPASTQPPRVTIAVDIDETISRTDYGSFFGFRGEGSHPYDNARDVLNRLSADFGIIYLTARPQWLFAETRAWLREAGFPAGPVVTTARLVDVFWPASFKTVSLALLRLGSPEILIGIGDRKTDVAAYSANGMLSLVVNPRQGGEYQNGAVVLPDWQEIGAFFDKHRDVLRYPDRLMARFNVSGERIDPSSIHVRADVDLSLLIELPLISPALVIEPLVKAESIHEQAEARQALKLAEVEFESVLDQAAELYGEDNLLKVHLGTHAGQPVYKVYFVRDGQVWQASVDGHTGAITSPRRSGGRMQDSLDARPLAQLTFRQALSRGLGELAGEPYELELEVDDGEPTYELAVQAQGQFVEIELHAATGTILEVENETAVP